MRIGLRHKQHHLVLDVHHEGRAYRVSVGDSTHHVEVQPVDTDTQVLIVDGQRYRVTIARAGSERLIAIDGEVYAFTPESGAATHAVGVLAPPEILAPMPGKVLQVLVQPGDHVAAGDGLLILEAMKMENRLVAEAAATVAELRVNEGAMVDGGQVLLVLTYKE